MSDSLTKVPIRFPMPGTLPRPDVPPLPGIPPGVKPPGGDDPVQRLKDAIQEARQAALQPDAGPPPPYTPDPMRNIENDLPLSALIEN